MLHPLQVNAEVRRMQAGQIRAAVKAVLAALALTPAVAVPLHAQAAKPVPSLDYARFVGSWYAVAQIPRKTKYPCAGQTTLLFALADKKNGFQAGSFCSLADGGSNDDQTSGKLDKSHNGTLKSGFIWPFTSKMLVLAAAPDYTWAMIGSPNHKKLVILSRTPELAPAQLDDLKARAAAEGYKVSKLASSETPSAPPKVSPLP
jgi:apolipoprotein D and lipocalin family protein